jgi:hypothetical protein
MPAAEHEPLAPEIEIIVARLLRRDEEMCHRKPPLGRQISLDFPGPGVDERRATEISIASSQWAASPSDGSTRPLSVDECDA